MIAQVIGLLLLFFRIHGLTLGIPTEDTCCKVQVQEKTGVTTTSIPTAAKSLIAPSRQSSLDCVLASCKTITFSGVFLSDHRQIDSCLSAFQERCSAAKPQLIFLSTGFLDNQLSQGWITFSTSLTIQSIRFEACQIDSIHSAAFDNPIFAGTEEFQLIGTNVSIFHRKLFQHLPNLRNLAVRNNPINSADPNSLSPIAGTLETLQLDASIKNLDVLRNMTLQSEFSKVQLLSLQGNNISSVSKELLSSFPNLQSLYLDSSEIVRITSDAFSGLVSIKQVFLRNNLLSRLPKTLFDSILAKNNEFQVALTNNPWKCDCELVWLQNLIKNRPNFVAVEPTCVSPNRNKNLGFLDANFCDKESISCNNSKDVIEISINCLKKFREAISKALTEGHVSSAGFDCVWKSVSVRKNCNDSCGKELWLSNEDKALVLSLYTIGTLLFGVLCAVGCFLIVRNNPGLLKGSKRVVMVKCAGINAMVLPKGVEIGGQEGNKRDNKGEIDYLTPIQANEYESIREDRGGKEESKGDNSPPPLPPHPFHGVRTVSLLMDGIDGKREVIDDCLL